MSDDGRSSVVIIALLGNPFSPAYARARARGSANPLDHCALHVALDGPGGGHWSLRERALKEAGRSARELDLGASRVEWTGHGLRVEVDETTTPGNSRLKGIVLLRPESSTAPPAPRVALDAKGDHGWWPIAPLARAEVTFREPAIRFEGHAYSDVNAGHAAIDAAFASWSWSRARVDDEHVVVAYDVIDRSGGERTSTMIFGPSGHVMADGIVRTGLARSRWGLGRRASADDDASATVVRTLEDGPCYARALVRTRLLKSDVTAVHEVLSGDRLRQAWVRFLLGFRIGRM